MGNHEELCQLANKHFGKISKEYDAEVPLDLNCRFSGASMDVRDDNMPYAHVAIAVQGASWTNPDNIPLMVANTFLGSWDRSMGNSVHSSNKIQEAQAKH